MTSKEFTEALVSLGDEKIEATLARTASSLLRLAGSLSQVSHTVTFDELLALSLEMVPRAIARYCPEATASLSTHIVTVARNACLSLLRKERTHAHREQALGYEQADVPRVNNLLSDVAYQDELDLLERVLSPYAWRLLMLIQQGAPSPLSGRVASEELHLSITSVNHLRDEIRAVAAAILGAPRRKGKNI